MSVVEIHYHTTDMLPWPPVVENSKCFVCCEETFTWDRRYLVFDWKKLKFRWVCDTCHDRGSAT